MEIQLTRVEWRFTTVAAGVPCATIIGTSIMPGWCVDSWATQAPSHTTHGRAMAKDRELFGWTTSFAMGTSPACQIASLMGGASMTAHTMRMWECNVRMVSCSVYVFFTRCALIRIFSWKVCGVGF